MNSFMTRFRGTEMLNRFSLLTKDSEDLGMQGKKKLKGTGLPSLFLSLRAQVLIFMHCINKVSNFPEDDKD